MTNEVWDAARRFIESQKATLMRKSYGELSALPASSPLTPPAGLAKFRFYVYRERQADGDTRITIQAERQFFFGMGKTAAVGFTVNPAGAIRDLRDSDL